VRTLRTLARSLAPALILLAAACDDRESAFEPSTPEAAPEAATPAAARRADGSMRVTRPAGTTGRYIVTFTGLSALLGSRSTVQVTEYGVTDTYCKPVNGRLVSDRLEVRCFRASTRAPANAAFSVLVTRERADGRSPTPICPPRPTTRRRPPDRTIPRAGCG
jgi:hypothetical protein